MDFDDFVAWLNTEEGQDSVADRHWISQHKFLYKEGHSLCQFIGKYENLEADWKIVCERIQIPHEPLKQKGYISATLSANNPGEISDNGSEVVKNNYTDFFTDETREAVRQRYQKDIELFGYEFDS